MKKLFLQFAILLVPMVLSAQTNVVDKMMDKYSGKEGFTSVSITKHMFQLFVDLDIEADAETEAAFDLLKNLDNIKILTTESNDAGVNFYEEVKGSISNDYKELMVVHEKDQDIKFLIKEKNKRISELLMIVGGTSDNAIISIIGDIDLKTIGKLSTSMNIHGMEHLNKIDK